MGDVTSIKGRKGRWQFRGIGCLGEETFRGGVERALSHKHLAMAKRFWRPNLEGITRKCEVVHPDGSAMVFETDAAGEIVEAA